jgi:two-component system response regulator ResD
MSAPPRALVVEDHNETRTLLRSLLESHGCIVDEAADGKAALLRLMETRYDIVLLDIVLPKLSGTAVMSYLAENDPEMLRRVIVVTGLSVADIRSLFPTVCQALSKPVMPSRLLAVVNDVLNGSANAQLTGV